jgi:anti-sigma regulatory factor (Ser/Thr protein kinase)
MEIDLLRQSIAIVIREAHDVGDARRQALSVVRELAFDETASGRVGIVATELAGNLAKHAGGGTLILRVLEAGSVAGVEIISIDDGPGMDVQRCLQDGYSTAGSPGTGLGAIKRISDSLDIYSLRGKGTVAVARLWRDMAPSEPFDIGAVCLPVGGEQYCGDGWAARLYEGGLEVMVCDGLGHGMIAAQATGLALEAFAKRAGQSPRELLETMHGALRASRGAAVLSIRLDVTRNLITCAGIGNITGYVFSSPKTKGMVSMNGIVGHQVLKVKEFTYDCAAEDLIILHSDGLITNWKLDEFPGLMTRSASLIAAVMYKHFKRGRDDSTVVVIRRQ